jgi:SAM-dependent methyltransferase
LKLCENNLICPLCGGRAENFLKGEFFRCSDCRGIFKARELLLSEQEEKVRYELHRNDVNDEGYCKFVMPLVSAVRENHGQSDEGLDFGSGTGSAVSYLLKKEGFNIVMYDPFFSDNADTLQRKYDFIAACEVIEHFYDPAKEFALLKTLLKTKGRLYFMTHVFEEGTDFEKWYYKNDPTHVFIYSEKTLEFIGQKFDFGRVSIVGRLVTFFGEPESS